MLAVYGNLIYDTIATVDQIRPGESHNCTISTRVGGIANTCRAASDLLPTTAITMVGADKIGELAIGELKKLCTTKFGIDPNNPTSQAVVLANPVSNIRTGLVQWGACRHYTGWRPLSSAKWHHLMYLDKLNVPDTVEFSRYGIVSADFCNSDEIINHLNILPHIDYLIVAEIENGHLFDYHLPVRKAVIVHSPTGSYVLKAGEMVKEAVIIKEQKLNVVGAGDYFAAYCIANLVADGDVDLNAVHRQTLALLRAQS